MVEKVIERIKLLLKEKGLKQKYLFEQIGMSPVLFRDWKAGKSKPTDSVIYRIADVLDTTPEYLLGKTDKKEKADADSIDLSKFGIFPIKLKKFRVLGEIACGKPIFADEDRETVILADAEIQADFCLYARGDSMTGARIMDGDIVFIRAQDMVDNGEIAAVVIGEEATLKRVYYYPDKHKLVLNAENPKYEPLVYIDEELNDIRILGKAVAFQSAVR